MNNTGVGRKNSILFESIVIQSFIIYSLCRSFKFINFSTYVFAFGVLAFCLVYCIAKYRIARFSYIEILVLCQMLFFLNANNLYNKGFLLMSFLSFLVMIIISYNHKAGMLSLWGILTFSILNTIINIINIVSPTMYNRIVSIVLSPYAHTQAQDLYLKYGFLSGLSSHYSRNAYYCVAGLTVLFAIILSGSKNSSKRNRTIIISLILVEIAMLMRIGKRGHFLFFVLSIFAVNLMMQNGTFKKIKKVIVLLTMSTIILMLLVSIVPEIGYVFSRITQMNESEDLSSGRWVLYERAIDMFKSKPIFGNGYGSFSSIVFSGNTTHYAGVHNDYLQWLCELGIVGFVVNMVFTIGVYSSGVKVLKRIVNDIKSTNTDKILIIWAMLLQTFVITYSLTGLPHYDYEINISYYLSCGVIIGMFNGMKISKAKNLIVRLSG